MRIALCFFILISSLGAIAQDLDYPDYRSKKDNFSKIPDKDIRSDLASFTMAGLDESIGKAPLRTIDIKEVGSNFMSFEGEGITVIIKTGIFFPTKHKMMYNEKHLVKIDGKPYYGGSYGEAPKSTLESVTAIIGKDSVSVPATALFDLYDPAFGYNQGGGTRTRNAVYLSNDKHTFYIYMMNPAGGGSEYTWVIRDKQFIRRVVDFSFLK